MNTIAKIRIKIREQKPGDENFFFDSYLKHNYYSKENTTTLRPETWQGIQRKKLLFVMKTQGIKVACLVPDPDIIVGYGFWDINKPFIYIKKPWRKYQTEIYELLIPHLEGQQ